MDDSSGATGGANDGSSHPATSTGTTEHPESASLLPPAEATGSLVVRAENVRKTYGETTALRGVSLGVAEGEIVGLIGPNGAGKTTLVRGLTGTTTVEGDITVFGDPPTAMDRSRIGLLPQSFAPAERLTARELLTYYAGLYDDHRPVEGVLDDVGLSEVADTRYERLSGGQQRRLCVGTALVNDPELLIVDEPTTGIDPAGRRAVWQVIETLAAAGTAVLVTSHSMREVTRLADRVGLVADGALLASGTPSALIDAHGGPPRVTIGLETASDAEQAVTTLRDAGYDATATDDTIRVTGVEPTAIADLIDTLPTTAYDSVVWREPGLEDAYLRLTGDRFAVDDTLRSDSPHRTGSDNPRPHRTGNDNPHPHRTGNDNPRPHRPDGDNPRPHRPGSDDPHTASDAAPDRSSSDTPTGSSEVTRDAERPRTNGTANDDQGGDQ